MKNLFLLMIMIIMAPTVYGQSIEIPEAPKHDADKKYKFFFDSPVKSIESIEYLQEGTPVKFKLDKKDHREVKIENYYQRGTLKINYTDQEGNAAVLMRSPCDIVVDEQFL